jgi:hypothetical protein
MDIARDVCDDLRLKRPPQTLFAAYNEGDTTDRDLLRAAVKCGRFLLAYHHWEHLKATHEFVTVAGAAQANAVPVDFHRLVPRTIYDTSKRVMLRQIESDEWSKAMEGGGLRPSIVFNHGGVQMVGPHSAGSTIRFTYMRRRICMATMTPGQTWGAPNAAPEPVGMLKETFTRDSDVPLWDAELFTLGMIWNLQHRDGDTRNEDYEAFMSKLHQQMDNDAPGDALNMNPTLASEIDDYDFSLPMTPWGT